MDLREAIKELRKTRGLSQEKFARQIDTGLATVQRWENGTFKPNSASLVTLYNIALENNRHDLAGVFVRGGAPPAQSGPVRGEAVEPLVDYITTAASDLTESMQPGLPEERRSELVSKALAQLIEGHKFGVEAMQDLL